MGTTHKKMSSLGLEWCSSVWTRTAALGRSSWGQFHLYQSEFSREIELVWYVQIHTNAFSMGIGSHNHRGQGTPSLSHANWSPRKASGAIPTHTRRPENQELWGPRIGDNRCRSSNKEHIHPFPAFCSIQALRGLHAPHSYWWGWSTLLLHWFESSSLPETASWICPEIIIYGLSGYPSAQWGGHIKLSITPSENNRYCLKVHSVQPCSVFNRNSDG